MSPISVALVDDHELVREGLEAWLAGSPINFTVLASTPTVYALRATPGWGADVVLLDVNLRDDTLVNDNIVALTSAGSQVVVVSESENMAVVAEALRAADAHT